MIRKKEELASIIVSVLSNQEHPVYAGNFTLISNLVEMTFSESAYKSFTQYVQHYFAGTDNGKFPTRHWLNDEDVETLYNELLK